MPWVAIIVVIVVAVVLLWWWLSRSPGGPTATYLPPRRDVEGVRPAPAPEAAPAAPVANAEPPAPAPVVEPPAPVAVVEATATAPTLAAEPPQPDDLTVIEGVGPKISGMLRGEGITTFARLAATDVSRLREIMLAANLRIANPATWPEQAALAAAGKSEELKALQDSLKGGRRA